MTFVLPLKTESCPVHKEIPDKEDRRFRRSRSPPDEEEFPVLKESPAALKDFFRGRPLGSNSSVPQESSSASEISVPSSAGLAAASSGSATGRLRMLSNYVEFLSKGADLDSEQDSSSRTTTDTYRLIPPPVDFSSSASDTEIVELFDKNPERLRSTVPRHRNTVDIKIRNGRGSVSPRISAPVLRTFQSGETKN